MIRDQEENRKIKVSVIVPVYRPGKLIKRCLDSLRAQTLREIELIFIDDCGGDDSIINIEKAAGEDSRIRILHSTANMGPGPSRNYGIAAAAGEYLSFMDADDYVDPDFLERLYKKAQEENADIVKGKIIYELADGTRTAKKENLNKTIRRELAEGKPLYGLFRYEHQSAVFKRPFVLENCLEYGSSRVSEDSTFLLRACLTGPEFSTDDEACYHYVASGDSLSGLLTADSLHERLKGYREQIESLNESAAADDEEAAVYLWHRLSYLLRIQADASGKKGLEKEADLFLKGLRDETRKLPQIQLLKKQAFGVFALTDYGENLSMVPFSTLWERGGMRGYLDVLRRWLSFAARHPRHGLVCLKHILRIVRRLIRNLAVE